MLGSLTEQTTNVVNFYGWEVCSIVALALPNSMHSHPRSTTGGAEFKMAFSHSHDSDSPEWLVPTWLSVFRVASVVRRRAWSVKDLSKQVLRSSI